MTTNNSYSDSFFCATSNELMTKVELTELFVADTCVDEGVQCGPYVTCTSQRMNFPRQSQGSPLDGKPIATREVSQDDRTTRKARYHVR